MVQFRQVFSLQTLTRRKLKNPELIPFYFILVNSAATQDFSAQTSQKVSQNTPRKTTQKKIKKQGKKIKRLQTALAKNSAQNKQKQQEKALEEALAKLPENMANFVKTQLKLHGKKSKGR